jgi:hypothetical protein
MVRKSPDKQWNHQNSILFHERIPLILCGLNPNPMSSSLFCSTGTGIELNTGIEIQ